MEKKELHRTSTGAESVKKYHLESFPIYIQRTDIRQCPGRGHNALLLLNLGGTQAQDGVVPRLLDVKDVENGSPQPYGGATLRKVAILSPWALLQMEPVETKWFQLATLPWMATRVLPRRPGILPYTNPYISMWAITI